MTKSITRFDIQVAPCGLLYDGERYLTGDQHGLVIEDMRFACGCRAAKEEFHDGSLHRMVLLHVGKVLADEELRGG
jgi:hypothetical protein